MNGLAELYRVLRTLMDNQHRTPAGVIVGLQYEVSKLSIDIRGQVDSNIVITESDKNLKGYIEQLEGIIFKLNEETL